MDWLTRLPWIGPRIAAALRTHAYRAFAHLQTVHWTRLAAAMTFTSFLSLFPLLAVVAAVGAALLTQQQLNTVEHKITEQIPGIAGQLDISGLVNNAGTVGGIAGAALLFTGIGWVSSLRDCLRAVWAKDDEGRNPVAAKLLDLGVLAGLGAAVLVSLAASGFATAAVTWTAHRVGLADHGPGRALLTLVGFCLAVVADFLILTYLLTLLPGVEPPRRSVVIASLIGAVGFELLKLLLSSYLQQVAGKSMYGAFGTPIALLLWINFMSKLLLYCAAWTATPIHVKEVEGSWRSDDPDDLDTTDLPADTAGPAASAASAAAGDANGARADAGSDARAGARADADAGVDTEAGVDAEVGTGAERGAGAGPGVDAGVDTEAGAGVGVSPGGAGNGHSAGAHRWRPRSKRPPHGRDLRTGADGDAVPR